MLNVFIILCLLLLFATHFHLGTFFALRLSVLILVTYNYDKFLIKVHSIFNRQLDVYVNMLISLYFLLLSYCHWFHCVVRVVLGVTNELYVSLLCCFILCACPR